MVKQRACPCGSGTTYRECCGRLHRGEAEAATAENLMRSRYSAYVLHEAAYLLDTWHPATRPGGVDLDDRIRWTGLEVLATVAGGADDIRGTVEFRATYVAADAPGVLHEASRFLRPDRRWLYVRGRIMD